MSQKVIEKKTTCPNCSHSFVVETPKGQGTVTTHLPTYKITQGIKLEILQAYKHFLDYGQPVLTTALIIDRINIVRTRNSKKGIQRSQLTRPHSELVGDRIIIDLNRLGKNHYYKMDLEKAKAFLKDGKF